MSRNLICLVSLAFVLGAVGTASGAEGLLGQYYKWTGSPPTEPWGTPVMERLDPTVNFNWGANAPDPSVGADNFAVRWTGEVVIPTSGTYTFHTQTDDGVRLWVNNVLIIDNWTDHSSTHDSGIIELTGGHRYPIKLEYYENTGDAVCQLSWSGPGIPQSPIPSQNLWVGGDRPAPYSPSPADGAILRETWVTLTWAPGDYAASHSVYVGENRDDVEAGTGDTFRASQVETSFGLGFPGFPYPDGLVSGTTYYWRIEEVEADGTTTHSGPVWSFSIAPKTAYNPSPLDGAQFVDPNVVLSWEPGFGAILHTVYFGTDYDAVNNAVGSIPQGARTYKPGTLGLGKVFYWRVDEFYGFQTVKGDVWSFTTPGAVGNPRPANHAVDVRQNQILRWSPAGSAASHKVYFGKDKDAVRSAGAGSPEYKGTKNLGSESYDPGMLDWDTPYYWRIDEVDNLGNASKGPLWSFTTADFLVVDDFEDYTDNDAANEAIWQTWIDGFGVAGNGSVVGYEMPPYAERTVVHSGSQSMPYSYDTDLKYAEATMTLTYPHDWTQKGVDTLTIWFHGDILNDVAPMYVALNGSAAVYHDDAKATQIHAWTKWNIPLQVFADKGVNLANVNTIAIGFGDKNKVQAGGAGKMYFDDIGVHAPKTAP
jgi:hypothetical protein